MNLIVSMLGRQELSHQEQTAYLHDLTGLLSRTQRLIDVLLKLSCIDAGVVKMRCEPVDCAELIKAAVAPLEISAELKGVAFELCIAENTGFTGDFTWSCEAITNIVKNCIEHTPEGGKITITAEENLISTQIIIRDNGTGIADKDLPHIFERFYKAESSSKQGCGIGLSLTRKIITQQNGIISTKNCKPCGSVFKICMYKSTV